MRRMQRVVLAVILLAACSRGAAKTPTTRTAFPTSSTTATTEAPATAPTTTAPPAPTGDDDKPQVQAVKSFFAAIHKATQAKNPDLIEPYVDPDTPDFVAAVKRGIIDDIAHGRFEQQQVLTTTLEVQDSIGKDGRHQAGVRVSYTATQNNQFVYVDQGFGVVWNDNHQRWLVFASGKAETAPR